MLAVMLVASAGCKGGDKSPPAPPREAPLPTETEPDSPPSARVQLDVWRSLIEESSRAELRAGGLFIDFGVAEQHKYTRGGWRTGWGDNRLDGQTSMAEVASRKATLDVVTDARVTEIVLRARSGMSGQRVTAYANEKPLGSFELGAAWSVVRVPLGERALNAGRHEIALRFSRSEAGRSRAELDWMWLSGQAGAEPPEATTLRVLPIRVGERPERAFIAPSPRSYSFYLQPPPNASLVLDYGSESGATFAVRAHVDAVGPGAGAGGTQTQTLFESEGSAAWTEAKVDLSALAGKAVRLELATTGPAGVSGWAEPAIMVPPPDNAAADKAAGATGKAAAPPRNVVVILIDTVRADVFGALNADTEVATPVYDRLASEATLFVNAYDNENWTKPSVATTLSSLYPSTHDTQKDTAELPEDVTLLSQHLQAQGFATAGFVANGYVSGKFGFEKGWDQFRNYIREGRRSEAEYVYADALAWLDEERDKAKPFFLYIQTIDPHVTYKVDRAYTKPYFEGDYRGVLGPTIDGKEQVALGKGKLAGAGPRDIDWLRALYYGEVAYHDEQMGEFLEALKAGGYLDDTLLVITNDHGEELGDHGKYGHGHSLYEELLRAPLLVRFPPRIPAGERIPEIVENVDVAPTVLELMELKPLKDAEGQSLVSLIDGEPGRRPYYAITEFLGGRRAVRVGRWKLMRSSGDWIKVYDLLADPGEQTDRADDRPIARRLCEVYMGEGLATPDKQERLQNMTARRRFKAGEAKIDPETRRQLEALGYFGDDAQRDVAPDEE